MLRPRADGLVTPTEEQLKAVASGTRLRILRLCHDQEWTNQELAARLALDPSTIHRHVRLLVDAGLLEPTGVRQGARGALEKPYRATGLSWRLDIQRIVTDEDPPATAGDSRGVPALMAAFRDELGEAGTDSIAELTRFHLRLTEERLAAFVAEFTALVERYDDGRGADGRGDDDAPTSLGGLFVLHRMLQQDAPRSG